MTADADERVTSAEKRRAFQALHEREGTFLLPNPWDLGSACLLAQMGFEALATTSAGFAFSMGRQDYSITREMVIQHVSMMAAATDLPLNADLENGFGDAPEATAETIRLAAEAGAAGGSIEDATGKAENPIYEMALAVERIHAAAEVAHKKEDRFLLTARCENYLHGRPDLKDTIERLQAYQEAGADVLYAPGLTRRDDITEVISSVDRPVNVLAGIKGMGMDRAALSAIGVKRISVGSALARAALTGWLQAALEMQEKGLFTRLEDAIGYREVMTKFPKRDDFER